jgi:hypothetical protein
MNNKILRNGNNRNETKPDKATLLGLQLKFIDSSQEKIALNRGNKAAHLNKGCKGFSLTFLAGHLKLGSFKRCSSCAQISWPCISWVNWCQLHSESAELQLVSSFYINIQAS